jgi:hypothetical protein
MIMKKDSRDHTSRPDSGKISNRRNEFWPVRRRGWTSFPRSAPGLVPGDEYIEHFTPGY